SLGGRALPLRRMEYELLARLAREPDRAFERERLLREIWRYRSSGSTRTVDTHASRLRATLRAADPAPWVIAVWGVGYRLRRPSRAPPRPSSRSTSPAAAARRVASPAAS